LEDRIPSDHLLRKIDKVLDLGWLRVELANYFAAAVLMPYDAFLTEARATKYDLDHIATRFSVSFEQACHRATTLQRDGAQGVPFFFLRIDKGGNVTKRFNATGFHLAEYGGACPRLDVHTSFRTPGRIVPQFVEMPDRSQFFTFWKLANREAKEVVRAEQDRTCRLILGLDTRDPFRAELEPLLVTCVLEEEDRPVSPSHSRKHRRLTGLAYKPERKRATGEFISIQRTLAPYLCAVQPACASAARPSAASGAPSGNHATTLRSSALRPKRPAGPRQLHALVRRQRAAATLRDCGERGSSPRPLPLHSRWSRRRSTETCAAAPAERPREPRAHSPETARLAERPPRSTRGSQYPGPQTAPRTKREPARGPPRPQA